ncbi:MAG: GtrA family protein [Treponema sp.]|nr:GtrA family protein [Treponema sp.]
MNKLKELFIKHKEIILYLLVGGMTTLVSWLTYAVLRLVLDVENPFWMQVAVVTRWIAGVTFAYVMNRMFVFESRNPNILAEAAKFTSARITTLLIEMFIMWLLPMCLPASVLGIKKDWIATFACAVIVTVLNYLFSKLLVFRKQTQAGA